MRLFNYIFLALVGLGLIACQNKKAPQPARLRVLSMIQFTPVTLTIRGKGKNKGVHKTLSLGYGNPMDYQQFRPGYYKITLSVKGKALLSGTYALGKNGYYTLLADGLLPEKWKVNPQTTIYKIKYILAGSEVESTNKNMPQWFMMRDNYDGNKKSAYIRFVNANPHTSTLAIKKDKKRIKSGLAYPRESPMLKLKPGNHHFQILYGAVRLGEKSINAKPGYIYTAVIGNKENSKDALTVRILRNPSRTLIKSN